MSEPTAALEQYLQGESMPRESLDEVSAALRLAIAADGVMVPFRPNPKTPRGVLLLLCLMVIPLMLIRQIDPSHNR